jgi:hypothetical protein
MTRNHSKQQTWYSPARHVEPDEYRALDKIEHPDLRALFGLWTTRRGERPMPERSEIRPHDMKRYLSRVHLYEVLDGGRDFRCTLQGSGLDFRRTVSTGQLLSQVENDVTRTRFTEILTKVTQTRAPVHIQINYPISVENVQFSRLEALWLPLGKDSKVQHVLACLQAE